MDRHDIGASGWNPGLLPESASSNHWHPKRDTDIEEMQGNGWGPGAGRKAFGRHWDRVAEMADGELQGRRGTGLGRQALWPRAATQGQQSQQQLCRNPLVTGTAFKKRRLKVQVCHISSLKRNTRFNFLLPSPTAFPEWPWHCTAGTNPCHHQRNSKFIPCSFTLVENSGPVYRATKGTPSEGWFHTEAVGNGLSRGSLRGETCWEHGDRAGRPLTLSRTRSATNAHKGPEMGVIRWCPCRARVTPPTSASHSTEAQQSRRQHDRRMLSKITP